MSSLTKLYERRNSAKMMAKSAPKEPAMIAYRDASGNIAYTPAPVASNPATHPEDSDGEPLIPTTSHPTEHAEAYQNFTATGRPIPAQKPSALVSWSGDMYSVPQLLPKQYTDDSIIPAIITGVIPSANPVGVVGEEGKKKKGLSKFFGKGKEEKDGKGVTKVVYMPRREYTRYFAKDNNGVYCGTEPFKQWTEDELEEKFGEYKPPPQPRRRKVL